VHLIRAHLSPSVVLILLKVLTANERGDWLRLSVLCNITYVMKPGDGIEAGRGL
jgi:hypothetical protein